MLVAVESWLRRARSAAGPTTAVILLRLLVGFAFVPAGLKKVLGQRFTDPANGGAFHELLHAFYATGAFYRFVGVLQLVAAALLVTQRFAFAGVVLALPIATAIMALCWSTGVVPTAIVITLIWFALVGMLLWDVDPRAVALRPRPSPPCPGVDLQRWQRCGLAMLVVYGVACAVEGGVYRPRGLELSDPRFYVFPAIMLLPTATLILERRRRL